MAEELALRLPDNYPARSHVGKGRPLNPASFRNDCAVSMSSKFCEDCAMALAHAIIMAIIAATSVVLNNSMFVRVSSITEGERADQEYDPW
jgi:hypothetical protein